MKIVKPSAELLSITHGAEKLIELAGRNCYKREHKITGDSEGEFVQMIINNGHESVIEHASATFRFICDRGVTHEMVRHRLAAYSQESTRYCNYSKDRFGNEITVIEPPGLDKLARKAWLYSIEIAERRYESMLQSGCTAQIARSVLPNCLKTDIVMTANLREWRHVFRLRTSNAAHPQIREIMFMALKIMKQECPNVFADFEMSDG